MTAPAPSLLQRLFRPAPDPRESVRPLWHAVVREAREPALFEQGGIADTVAGRFDAITAVLATTVLQMERVPELAPKTAYLVELFVEDMDGQLREFGVGDIVVGKHVGRLMSALGGRLGAYRDAFASADNDALEEVLRRNVTFADPERAPALAAQLRTLAHRLAGLSPATLLAGRLA